MSRTGSFPVLPLPSTITKWRGRSINISSVANKGRKPVRERAKKISSVANKGRKPVRERAKKSQLSSGSGSGGSGDRKTGFGAGERKEEWRCIRGCGACCKLDKGPSFATPEEIFESQSDVQLYKSLIGSDGWCVHFEKTTRRCSIYADRPYFCRVKPQVFQDLYGISEKKFNKEACSFCRDTIKAIHGARSEELDNFNHAVRSADVSADCTMP